ETPRSPLHARRPATAGEIPAAASAVVGTPSSAPASAGLPAARSGRSSPARRPPRRASAPLAVERAQPRAPARQVAGLGAPRHPHQRLPRRLEPVLVVALDRELEPV